MFVLPVVVGLVALAWLMPAGPGGVGRGWGAVHGVLVLLAAIGISVGFLASVMYLVQANRLRAKANPTPRLKLLSLERLEAMNRRAIALALPLLTADSAIASNLALARTFMPRAKALCTSLGVEWPAAFEAATRRNLQRALPDLSIEW